MTETITPELERVARAMETVAVGGPDDGNVRQNLEAHFLTDFPDKAEIAAVNAILDRLFAKLALAALLAIREPSEGMVKAMERTIFSLENLLGDDPNEDGKTFTAAIDHILGPPITGSAP